jgi:hypothetical protein
VAVWDCVLVNDEIDLLRARLRVLDGHVDGFVVCEGDRTFTGLPKPLHFAENAASFAEWSDRIVHVVARLPEVAESPWVRENAQRETLRAAIGDLDPGDLVLMCDVDEFPPLDRLRELDRTLTTPGIFHMPHAIYYVDWLAPQEFRHIVAFRARDYDRAVALQRAPGGWGGDDLSGGLHVSFLGGAERVQAKLAAYSHTEYALPRITRLDHLRRCLAYRAHFAGTLALRVVPRAEWTALQHALAAELPECVSAPPYVSAARSEAFCGYARLRRISLLPDGVVAAADRSSGWLLAVLGPAFRLVYRLLRRRAPS